MHFYSVLFVCDGQLGSSGNKIRMIVFCDFRYIDDVPQNYQIRFILGIYLVLSITYLIFPT